MMACCRSIRSRLATPSAVMTKQNKAVVTQLPNELLVHLYPLDSASILAADCFKMPLEIHGHLRSERRQVEKGRGNVLRHSWSRRAGGPAEV